VAHGRGGLTHSQEDSLETTPSTIRSAIASKCSIWPSISANARIASLAASLVVTPRRTAIVRSFSFVLRSMRSVNWIDLLCDAAGVLLSEPDAKACPDLTLRRQMGDGSSVYPNWDTLTPMRSSTDSQTAKGAMVTPSHDELRDAARRVLEAALKWEEQDYGDQGELGADAALSDAVRMLRREAARAGTTPADLLASV